MDPLAEKYSGWSPYAYALDNPLNRVDPDGKDSYFHASTIGKEATIRGFNLWRTTPEGKRQWTWIEGNHDILVIFAVGYVAGGLGIVEPNTQGERCPKQVVGGGDWERYYLIKEAESVPVGNRQEFIVILDEAKFNEYKLSDPVITTTIWHEIIAHIEKFLEGKTGKEAHHEIGHPVPKGFNPMYHTASKRSPTGKFYKSALMAPYSYNPFTGEQNYEKPESLQRGNK